MIVAQQVVYDGWTRLRRVSLRMANGACEERHIEDHGTAVSVLPYNADKGTVLLVSMPRAPVLAAAEPDLLEAIAGRLEAADPEAEAKREALEEAGVQLGHLEFVAQVWTMPSLSTERIWLYLAPYVDADRVTSGGGAEGENEQISVHEVALDSLAELVRSGALADMKTLLLVQALQLRRPELFS